MTNSSAIDEPVDEPGADAAHVAARRTAVLDRIAASARDAGRDPGDVTLVAVSKQQGDARVDAALAAGQRVFGENRVQEAVTRWTPRRPAHSDLELRLIGPLQTNKVDAALALFDVIETLDRDKLAAAIAKRVAAGAAPPRLYAQVNTGEEPQKSGVSPHETAAFVARCRDAFGLTVEGLMCIPPADEEPALHFALLADLADRCGVSGLSMGMSGDFETAVRIGATSVRVGSGVFGARPAPAG